MPDKEGSDDEKTTKDVVNKKQKQMMNKEEYAIEMVRKIRKIKKKINPKAVFPPAAQSDIKNKVITDIDNKNISPNIPSTVNKNPIKKKLQNNLDEEGYDIARDMGRVPKTKDKRDASSYPVSKEVRNMKGDTPMQKEFKKKYGKKATALDAVKQKYKGQIMDVKKEELDLSQVAEAFGGYIIESPKNPKFFNKKTEDEFEDSPEKKQNIGQRGNPRRIRKTWRDTKAKAIRDIVRSGGAKITGGGGTPKQKQTAKDILAKVVGKTDSGGTINVGGAKVSEKDLRDASKIKNTGKFANVEGETPIKPKQLELPLSKKPRVFSYMRKPSPEAQKRVDAVMRGIKARETLNPDKRSRKRVSASGTEFKIPSKPKVPKFKKTPIKLTKPSDVELPQSFKDFSSKLKSLKADIKQSKNKVKEPSRSDTSSSYDIEQLKKRGQYDQYKKIKDSTPKGGIPDWMKQVDKKRKEIQQQPYQKGVKPAFKRVFLTKGKGVRGLASKIVRNPVGTAIAAGVARDSFRMPQLPQAPKVSGGKVGRRTAG